jgi:hypothetical protein
MSYRLSVAGALGSANVNSHERERSISIFQPTHRTKRYVARAFWFRIREIMSLSAAATIFSGNIENASVFINLTNFVIIFIEEVRGHFNEVMAFSTFTSRVLLSMSVNTR